MSEHVLVTGANGFVGRPLCRALLDRGFKVSGAVRRADRPLPEGVAPQVVGDIGPATDWVDALFTVDSVIHLAARVHVMDETAKDPLAAHRRINTQGTLHLAEMAADAGVRRFVYVSTVKVNGEATRGMAFNESDPANPSDPYAVSKWEAEQGLMHLSRRTGMEVVIVRPPLVYGPGVKGNFRSLMEIVAKGVPLPLKNVVNRRALIYVDNLVDALIACLTKPEAAGRTYLVRDDEEPSTAGLITHIATAMGRAPRLIGVPPKALRLAGRWTGKTAAVERLTGSLSIDDGRIRSELDWEPPHSMAVGMARTVADFLARRKR